MGASARVRCEGVVQRAQSELFDRLILAQVAKAGGDLTTPIGVVNFTYFPSEEAAHRAADELEGSGYRVNVQRAVMGPKWLTQARMDMVPSAENVATQRARFETLAATYGGEYDGWEAQTRR
jgi:hypothetical protein